MKKNHVLRGFFVSQSKSKVGMGYLLIGYLLIRLICIKNLKPRTPFDFMTYIFNHKRIKVLSKETKYFYFVNLNLFQILFSFRYWNNPETSGKHDNVTSGLIGVNWCNSCLLFTFDLYFLNRKEHKVLPKETNYFCFVNLNLFQILFSLRCWNNPEASGQHDNIMSGLIGVNWYNSCLLFTFDFRLFFNRKERKVLRKAR